MTTLMIGGIETEGYIKEFLVKTGVVNETKRPDMTVVFTALRYFRTKNAMFPENLPKNARILVTINGPTTPEQYETIRNGVWEGLQLNRECVVNLVYLNEPELEKELMQSLFKTIDEKQRE